MKALIPLLIVSTSALAATTLQYAQRASTEGKRADQAEAIIEQQKTTLRELQQERNNIRLGLADTPRVAPPAVESSVSAASKAAATVPKPARTIGAPAPALGVLTRVDAAAGTSEGRLMPWTTMQRELSPAAQRYMRAQMRASLRRQYEDVGSAMGMSPEEANKFIDLLTEQQTRGMGEVRKPNVDMKQAMQAAQEAKKRNDVEIAALIGQARLPLWEQYQQSMPERSQVNMLREQMQNMGAPITDDQRARLVDMMIEYRQSNPRPAPTQGLAPEDMFAQSMKWQEESNRVMLERAKGVLTSEQYQHYKDYQEWHNEMRSNSVRMFRAGPGAVSGVIGSASATSYIAADPAQK